MQQINLNAPHGITAVEDLDMLLLLLKVIGIRRASIARRENSLEISLCCRLSWSDIKAIAEYLAPYLAGFTTHTAVYKGLRWYDNVVTPFQIKDTTQTTTGAPGGH